jgi:DNA-binding LacI/PurR family transcriptional regulator
MDRMQNTGGRRAKCPEGVESLRSLIQTGRYEPGEMVGTEGEFARKWGLARNTVRRWVESLVEEGLIERRPGKGIFVKLPSTAAKVIQVVVPNISWEYSVRIVHAVQAAAAQTGIQVQIYDAHGRMELDLEFVRRLPDRLMDGAIIISIHHPRFSEVLFDLKSAGFPFVVADQRLRDLDVPTVENDSYRAAYLVGKKLAELQHERIACVGPFGISAVADRRSGFRDAMHDARIFCDRSLELDLGGEGLIDFYNDRIDAAVPLIKALLQRPDRPTAIFDVSGDVAAQIYLAAQELGLRIPDDLSVVTFDDLAIRNLRPVVAHYRQPWSDMGRTALAMLMRQIERKGAMRRAPSEHHVLEGMLVAGESLALNPEKVKA